MVSNPIKIEEKTKYAVVTGASSGIGWHISKELAIKGYSILAVSNQSDKLDQLKAELEENYSVQVKTIDCDLSQSNAADIIFNYCKNNELLVEVLVNNAGILVYGEVLNINMKTTSSILQLHMNTPVMLCRLFAEQMVINKKGYILNVSSISSAMPYPTIALYGPTKTFIRRFSRALRTELKNENVNVSCLLPGATATALYDPEKVNMPLAIKLGIMKKAEEVAKAGVIALFKKKPEKITGLINKFIILLVPLIPNFIIELIYKKTKKTNS